MMHDSENQGRKKATSAIYGQVRSHDTNHGHHYEGITQHKQHTFVPMNMNTTKTYGAKIDGTHILCGLDMGIAWTEWAGIGGGGLVGSGSVQ